MLNPRQDDYGLRISSFKYLAECEYMFLLAQQYELAQTDAMRDGKLLESYLFGFRNDEEKKKLEGRKQEKTLKQFKDKAENLKKYFKSGKAWARLQTIVNGKKVSGEPDFVGEVVVDGEVIEALPDLKNTGDIFKMWDNLTSRFDYIQSVGYNWLRWKNSLSILPFVYFVNENNPDGEIIRPIVVDVTIEDVLWFDALVDKYTKPFLADYNSDRCKGRTYKEGRCQFCVVCPFGRQLLTETIRIKFSELDDPLKIQVNEQAKFDAMKPKHKEKTTEDELIVEESDIDKLLETGTAKKFDSLTYLNEEWKGETLLCRSCRNRSIKEGDEKCQNCHIQIKWI